MLNSSNGAAPSLALAQSPAGAGEGDEIDLGKLLQALRRRRRLAVSVMLASVLVGAGITFLQRAFSPTFAGSFKLLVSDPINQESNSAPSDTGSDLESLALQGGGRTNTGTLIEVLTSPLLLEPLESQLGLAPGSLAARVTVAAAGDRKGGIDGVLVVNLQWPDAAQGEAILQKLSRSYLAYSLSQRQEKLTQGLAFLDQQAPALQHRLGDLQNRLAAFRLANSYVQPEQQAGVIQGQREGLGDQIKTLQQEQARLMGEAAAVRRGQLGASVASAPLVLPGALSGSAAGGQQAAGPQAQANGSGSAAGRALAPTNSAAPLDDLNAVETALAEAEANFHDNAPQVRELRAKRDRLRPLLQGRRLAELQSQLSQNLTQQREIQRQLDQLSRRFAANPQQIKQYDSLQQQLELARDNLTSYFQARESFRLQMAQRTLPWHILSPPAFASRPVAPSVPRNLALSLALGALAGVGLALLRDRLDHVFHSARELKEALIKEGQGLPLLGVVPYLPGRDVNTISLALAAMASGLRFEIKESLRNLFANFRMLRADKAVRLVAITSSIQGEGKSTTTALFAQTLADLGQRVLLVDADMRRPMLHRYVGVDNGVGFSSLLTDASIAIESTIQPIQNGLDLLSSGPMPPDATRLLSSERCGVVVEAIRQLPGYDLVLFDTPPAFLLSDPVLLASHLDGLLFLVGLSRVNRDLPGQALQRVRETGVDVLGVLANQPVGRGAGYGKAYGYGYGYGYGDRDASGYGAYAKAAERQAGGEAETAQPKAPVAVGSAGSPGRGPSLRAGTRRLMQWLDERE